jgi:hypothetical protein
MSPAAKPCLSSASRISITSLRGACSHSACGWLTSSETPTSRARWVAKAVLPEKSSASINSTLQAAHRIAPSPSGGRLGWGQAERPMDAPRAPTPALPRKGREKESDTADVMAAPGPARPIRPAARPRAATGRRPDRPHATPDAVRARPADHFGRHRAQQAVGLVDAHAVLPAHDQVRLRRRTRIGRGGHVAETHVVLLRSAPAEEADVLHDHAQGEHRERGPHPSIGAEPAADAAPPAALGPRLRPGGARGRGCSGCRLGRLRRRRAQLQADGAVQRLVIGARVLRAERRARKHREHAAHGAQRDAAGRGRDGQHLLRGPFVVHRADRREPRGRDLAEHARAQLRAGFERQHVPGLDETEGRLEGFVVGLEQHVEGTCPVGLARGHPALPEIALDATVQQHAEQPPFVQHADQAARRPACGERRAGRQPRGAGPIR